MVTAVARCGARRGGARAGWLLLGLACLGPASALADDAEATDFKLTLGRYASSDGNPAVDVNLRGSRGPHTGWVGVYQDRAGLRQWRSGLEDHRDGAWLRTVLSLQNASGGAWIGAATAEVGTSSYAIVGWGRTNLRDYVNLNYDPNDAITFGAGTRAIAQTELTAFQVRDDRLHTGQRVTHVVARRHFADDQRLTIDLFAKRGLTNDGLAIHTRSWSVGYDRGALFARYTHDPHAGFTEPTQNRLSIGTRF